jgi:hypothetical protein
LKASLRRPFVPAREWQGDTCIVLGSGRSITDLGHDKILPHFEGRYPIIACNSSFLIVPTCEVLFGADIRWWRENEWNIKRHLGFFKVARRPLTGKQPYPVHYVRSEHKGGLSLDPSVIYGRNSGHLALNLSIHFGASRVILVGFDMVTEQRGAQNWHTLHSRPANVDAFKTWIGDLELAAPILMKNAVSVLNANPNSAISCFDFTDLRDWL